MRDTENQLRPQRRLRPKGWLHRQLRDNRPVRINSRFLEQYNNPDNLDSPGNHDKCLEPSPLPEA
jgi:hypothetical protein